MPKSGVRGIVLLAWIALAGSAGAGAATTIGQAGELGQFAEIPGQLEFSGELIVRPKTAAAFLPTGSAGRGLADLSAFVAATQREARARQRLVPLTRRYWSGLDFYVVSAAGPRGVAENTLIRELLATGDYELAEPNWICAPTAIPNDPQYSSQWQWPRIQAPQAWDVNTGNSNIIVAICDSGIDLNHPDLQNRVPGYNSSQARTQAAGGEIDDNNGHGTFCSGMAAARGNNSIGVTGAGWNLRLMPVKVNTGSTGNANMDAILGGAYWAVQNGAKVSSCSFTGVASSSVQITGASIKSLGGLLVYAADNNNTNHSSWDHADVVVVGATDPSDNKAWFSSYGLGVDLFAPGDGVYSTVDGATYGSGSGTSFSTPLVAGVIGMIWSINPNLPPAQVENILYTSCDDLGTPGNDSYWGWGRVNLRKAAQAAGATLAPLAPTPAPDSATVYTSGSTTIDVLANDTDPNFDSVSIASFPAATAKGGTVTRSVGTGPGGRDQLIYTAPAVAVSGNTDSFTYTARDPGGLTANATVTVNVLNATAFRNADNPASTALGLRATYYVVPVLSALPNFDALTPYQSNIQTRLAFGNNSAAFPGSGRSDFLAVRYDTFINAPAIGLYTFFLSSDEGSKLWVGDQLVVNNDGIHLFTEASGTIGLKPGRHRVRVEYFEQTGNNGLILNWQSDTGIAKDIVPPSAYSYSLCPTDLNSDGFTDDADFTLFAAAYDAFTSPLGDFNNDGFTDDADFVIFAAAYDAFTCP